jgi:hypothetical protein
MNRRRPEQIVKLLRKAGEELAKGKALEDFCREEQISPAACYRWQRKYGGLQVEDAKRLKTLVSIFARMFTTGFRPKFTRGFHPKFTTLPALWAGTRAGVRAAPFV